MLHSAQAAGSNFKVSSSQVTALFFGAAAVQVSLVESVGAVESGVQVDPSAQVFPQASHLFE